MCAMKVTILGCGAAPGVPSISTGWGECDPDDPRNRRQRASIMVEEGMADEGPAKQGGTRLLVDASPDLRRQLLDHGVRRLDAVLFTHAHADHLHGIDELREINRVTSKPLTAFATAETLAAIRARFGYAFAGIPPGAPIFRPWLIPADIVPGVPFQAGGMSVLPFLQDHGGSSTLGYRFGDVVYSTDVLDLPPASRDAIKGAKLWILGAYGLAPHPTHIHVDKALDWIAALAPIRAVITHMSNAIDYETLRRRLPPNVVPAHDGLVIEV